MSCSLLGVWFIVVFLYHIIGVLCFILQDLLYKMHHSTLIMGFTHHITELLWFKFHYLHLILYHMHYKIYSTLLVHFSLSILQTLTIYSHFMFAKHCYFILTSLYFITNLGNKWTHGAYGTEYDMFKMQLHMLKT